MRRLGIFQRLAIGYTVTFILLIGAIIYAISELHRLNNTTRHILEINTRTMEYEKRLTDSLLSQMRYEKKYIVLKDDILYEQFLSANSDFIQSLEEIETTSDIPQIGDLLQMVRKYHKHYQSLFDEEVGIIKANETYFKSLYEYGKEKDIEVIMEELKRLKMLSQDYTNDRIAALSQAGADAQRVAMAIAIAGLFWGIAFSFYTTRNITKPLSAMVEKTKEISEGVFKGDLHVSALPEIEKLTNAFNSMCSRLGMVDKMKSDFFAAMSHELRTPLTSIKEGTSLLIEGIGGVVADKQRRLLTIIYEESHRLIELVNSLLDFSKMEAGMMDFNYTRGDIGPLINRAVTEIEPWAAAKGITLNVGAVPNLPVIRLDKERVLQVLRNLIGNAVKFTPNGGAVYIFAREIDENLEVAVRDTGPGIASENLDAIFEKFQQGFQQGADQIKGTGLGLAIVKHIVIAHGGKIWAKSQPEKGSTFVFSLPTC